MTLTKLATIATCFFLLFYFLTGIYVIWDARNLFFLSVGNLIIVGYVAIPAIVASVGTVALLKSKNSLIYVGICAVYWLFNTYEIFFGMKTSRSEDAISVSMFVVSIVAIGFLVINTIYKNRNSRSKN